MVYLQFSRKKNLKQLSIFYLGEESLQLSEQLSWIYLSDINSQFWDINQPQTIPQYDNSLRIQRSSNAKFCRLFFSEALFFNNDFPLAFVALHFQFKL